MKKIRIKVWSGFLVALLLAVLVKGSTSFVQAKDNEVNITWNIPHNIKIGEKYGLLATVSNLPELNLNDDFKAYVTVCPYSDYLDGDIFCENGYCSHAFGPAEITGSDDLIKIIAGHNMVSAFRPSVINLQPTIIIADKNDQVIEKKEIAGAYTVVIEEPVIEDNAPREVEKGTSVELNTTLTNTALVNTDVAYYLDPDNYDYYLKEDSTHKEHEAAFRPSVEIIEGADLVVQSEQDYTNTLKSSEKLTFKGTGTVKLKITYSQIANCPCILNDGSWPTVNLYNAEKIITIQVKEHAGDISTTKDKASLDALIKKSQNISPTEYTVDSYKNFSEALEKAISVFKNPNATETEIEKAYSELEYAKNNLKRVNKDTKGKNTDGKVPVIKNSKKEVPKTGDNSNWKIYIIAVIVSCGLIIILKRYKKTCRK